MRRFGERRVVARRLVRAFPDDLRLSTRRGLLDRLFDRRGDRRGDRDLRRAGMCLPMRCTKKNSGCVTTE